MQRRDSGNAIAGGWLRLAVFTIGVCGLLAVPSVSHAQAEITGVVGGLVGGDLNNVIAGDVSIGGAFDNGPTFGVRVGWMGPFVGVEGSFVGSPSGVSLSFPNQPLGLNGKVYYLEANVLLIPIPGPISPFFTAGGGWHYYDFDLSVGGLTSRDLTIDKAGWNFGGGLKINISAITIRGEVRDHVTRLGPGDLELEALAEELGLDEEENVHNVEISAGIGFRF